MNLAESVRSRGVILPDLKNVVKYYDRILKYYDKIDILLFKFRYTEILRILSNAEKYERRDIIGPF
ncbi:MAG: hypothetical protein KAV25_01905 [Methanophagales archaeon]|nr:hypothetical protein [Methanophagales archaeon]